MLFLVYFLKILGEFFLIFSHFPDHNNQWSFSLKSRKILIYRLILRFRLLSVFLVFKYFFSCFLFLFSVFIYWCSVWSWKIFFWLFMSLNFISDRVPSLFFLIKNKEVRHSGNGCKFSPRILRNLQRFLKTYFMSLRIKLFVLFPVF